MGCIYGGVCSSLVAFFSLPPPPQPKDGLSRSFSLSLNFNFNLSALLAWETYVYIAKASEKDNKQK
jgi:hypothetical protein